MPMKLPADLGQYDFGIRSAKLLSELLESEKVRPGAVMLMAKGLASVKEGFEYMEAGKVGISHTYAAKQLALVLK